ncbi:hypothetical protein BLNAU_13399 [Blattamonas nauphoetae]|uniref:Uncharacterized protein n=1 Tax=Blattamonas nauphoetae TaxID=2049346 RepID=A0ABQ9XKD1_9EUKA|nr:hypothetical protein BLNAU_13399 [Blattamonas nauphoetae]
MTALDTKTSPSLDYSCPATLKFQPALDVSLESKVVNFLTTVYPQTTESANAFVDSHAPFSDGSLINFIQSIVLLLSSTSQAITTVAMSMLDNLILTFSPRLRLALVQADLISQVIITLNPLLISFKDCKKLHFYLISTITTSLRLSSLVGLTYYAIEDRNEQQAVYETILKHVLTPSEQYICHLCVHRFSIVDSEQSKRYLALLAILFRIAPSYPPTMEFVLNMPFVLTIPSCLTFFERHDSIQLFLSLMASTQREWNKKRGEEQPMRTIVDRLLRMEGIEDVKETKLRNDKKTPKGDVIILHSIDWNNLQGMNVPRRW